MRRFVVCIHDASPAYAVETQAMFRDLAPLVGRRLSIGVVPDWHGEWPLASHPDYCALIANSAEEILLHGCVHRRQRGRGPISLLTAASDEMNGLDRDGTQRAIERGQSILTEAFGNPARGFLAPAWQTGHVRASRALELDYVLGYFALASSAGRSIPLATSTWDCGRWAWLGHIGHELGRQLRSMNRIPVLAIHPADLKRGFWPKIIRLTEELLARGYEPATPAMLLQSVERPVETLLDAERC